MTRRSLLTAAVAVLGLALSAALAWSASQLAGQRIGLASEPLAVTQGLAPHHRAGSVPKPVHDDHHKAGTKPASAPKTATTTSSPQIFSTPAVTPATPVAPATPTATSAAPPATRTTASSSAASPSSSSSGASRHRDDHHPDD